MTTTIILLIIFNVIASAAIFIVFAKGVKKQSKPNVFLERKEANDNLLEEIKTYKWNPEGELNKKLEETEKDLRIAKLENISHPLILTLKAASEAANTIKLVNDYHQAIEQENYELAGELHKQIEALKNESSAHND